MAPALSHGTHHAGSWGWPGPLEIKQGHPEPAVPLGFEHPRGWRPHNLPQPPTPATHHPYSREKKTKQNMYFHTFRWRFTCCGLCPPQSPAAAVAPCPELGPAYPTPEKRKSHLEPNSCPIFLQKRRKTQICEALRLAGSSTRRLHVLCFKSGVKKTQTNIIN